MKQNELLADILNEYNQGNTAQEICDKLDLDPQELREEVYNFYMDILDELNAAFYNDEQFESEEPYSNEPF
jgi:hypothetical protein